MDILKNKVFDIEFKNPILPASGTFNSGEEINELFYKIHILGGIISKSVTKEMRVGNDHPRVCDTELGMLNAIGLSNKGIENFLMKDLKFLKKIDTNIIINIAGKTIEDYVFIINKLKTFNFIKAFEINASCPNVASGISFLESYSLFEDLIKKCRKATNKPLIIKLSPEGKKISKLALLAEKHGANAITLINTIKGMRIDLSNYKPFLANKIGGYSGSGIKPIALRHVYETYKLVKIPIIGVGGISNAYDVLEYLMAGASLVQIGTANFVEPKIMQKIILELPILLKKYNFETIKQVIGFAHK